ncbi:MAG: nicotinate phosphoribosyltransferase [Candidatus Pacebacteria bacterium]|nr:nicotinate phosphoribosyltransferase [Candidatus Paceibacterota bacterium]
MLNNILLMTDSYKVSHYRQYPKGTNKIYSYLEARTGGEYAEVMFFGLQYILKRYLTSQVVTQQKIDQAEALFKAHFGDATLFNRAGWEYILTKHGGRLPVEIKAVPEGLVIPEGNVLLTIENTCPKCYWLVNYLETLLVQVWYSCTTGTISREMKKLIKNALAKSGTDTPENLAFKLHDFGYRGVSSSESAAIGGAAHLVNFMGTDTLAAVEMLMEYYGAGMPGFSVPAAEHSTITSWGEDGEEQAYKNMLEQYPTGLVAVVSDSWNIRNAVENIWGDRLRNQVLFRDGVLIVRPDSGDPKKVLPALLEILGRRFGAVPNSKGFKVLHQKVRMIQGDGITRRSLGGILDTVMEHGWSADCLAFGSGGGLLQNCDRDTQRFAMKCSYAEVGGVGRGVFKKPATDKTKNSKKGRLMLAEDPIFETTNGSRFVTLPEDTNGFTDVLVPVFKNGELLREYTLDEVRARAMIT